MASVKIQPKVKGLPSSARVLRDYDKRVQQYTREYVRTNKDKYLRRMKQRARKPRYPITWDSERQRRAYFATDGFGAGIPYGRTQKLNNSYYLQARAVRSGAIVVMGNRDPKSPYVVGALNRRNRQRQSAIHKSRWKLARDRAQPVMQDLADDTTDYVRGRILRDIRSESRKR